MKRRNGLTAAALTASTLIAAALAMPLTANATEPSAGNAPAPTRTTGATTCADPISFGYYRMWRDISTTKPEDRMLNSQRMDDIPAGVDVVSAFATRPSDDPDMWQAMKDTYIPALHAQGTKVVFTIFVEEIIKDTIPMTPAGYQTEADRIYDTYIGPWGMDGLDIDMERRLSTTEATRAVGVLSALSARLGPLSGTSKLFIYDTNMTGSEPIFQKTSSFYDYVLLQAYGRSVSSLQGTWESFAPYISSCQFLPGFSFYEERSPAKWGDAVGAIEQSRAGRYASWQPQGGQKGGFFSYAIDRDGKAQTDDTITRTTFEWTTRLNAIQDESVRASTLSLTPSATVRYLAR